GAGGGHADVQRVARVRVLAFDVFGAQNAVEVGRAREAGEDLAAVDEPAPIDLSGRGAERCAAGRGRRTLAEGLRVDRAAVHDALEVQLAPCGVLGALRVRHRY